MLENSVVNKKTTPVPEEDLTFEKEEILRDYRIGWISREASLLGRKEVLTGKAKFGILGDGKEVPQLAMAHVFRKGDWRSGYYRDQTLMFALDLSKVEDFFAQLYADAENDPFSGGRQMNSHYATPTIDADGNWLDHTELYNISADLSPTAGQMARSLGLAFASKKFKELELPESFNLLSNDGNEVCFATIGDASTSEGIFWETVNAASVLKVPLAVSVWDDGYGISVPIDYQTTKKSISKALAGFQFENGEGMRIYTVKAWDYVALRKTYQQAIRETRETHVPCLIHVQEVTQPQGHSTSGSHERYKSKEQLHWEDEMDCLRKMREWILEEGMATADELDAIQKEAKKFVRESRDRAWKAYNDPVKQQIKALLPLYAQLAEAAPQNTSIPEYQKEFKNLIHPVYSEIVQNVRRVLYATLGLDVPARQELQKWLGEAEQNGHQWFHTHLYSHTAKSALKVPVVAPIYPEDASQKNGYEILNQFFDKKFTEYPELVAFGEDVGQIGDVNQGFAGMQKKYGEERVFDTGIREWSIIGQAIGLAMRGLRPIAEIQYLDYLIYALEPLTDDLATLRYRSNGIQHAPAIIRTRGHRLEGIWHAGSPLGLILNSLRGIYVMVPRNMTQAAGFYNTLLQSDDPGLVIECLNGYRLKEKMPDNLGEYTVPLGVPEILQEGNDITLVTYGSCIRVAEKGIELLRPYGISVELIDAQTLLPFDMEHQIVESLKKTNRILFMDEDVPGGATAYMMREVLEKQNGYRYLDSPPQTLTASAHRPPYGSDGDYFSKPNPENVFETIYKMIYEAEPNRFPGKI
jgi:pyruvate/2-oxoglutarate/acetoin dehydrogenase E1 component/TPP-dependent pyruvate/acetoin dehydrogenase alpha subunit